MQYLQYPTTYKYLFLLSIILISIVTLLLTPFETFYDSKITEDDLKVFKKGALYNLGDLLLIPKISQDVWHEKQEHEAYKPTVNEYKDSILAIYETQRSSPDEPIPHIGHIRESVDIYIKRNIEDKEFKYLLDFVGQPHVLCVHMRTGDYGKISDVFRDIIFELQNEYEYVVIMCGVHFKDDWAYSSFIKSIETLFNDNTVNDDNENKQNKKKLLISIEDPDTHLSMFRSCKNLLLCKNGFSVLAGLVFQGDKLYISKKVINENHGRGLDSEWINYLDMENRVFRDLIYIE